MERATRHQWTASDSRQLEALLAAGVGLRAIGTILGTSHVAVWRRAKQLQMPRCSECGQRPRPPQWEKAGGSTP